MSHVSSAQNGLGKRRSVILMGKGDLAIRAAEWFLASTDYELRMIVPVIPEPKWAASLAGWAKAHGIPVVASGHFRDIPDVMNENWRADVVLSVFYDKIIKEWFIQKCEKILNLHNGPLPRYRGVSPINWALKNEEKEHGVTIHEITPGIDDGPIVGQLKYSIYPESDEVVDVYKRSIEYGWVLLQQTLPLIHTIKPRPQNHADALYYNAKQNDLLGERRSFTKRESLSAVRVQHAAAGAGEVTR
jgi:methionyl-tRNA formyltransferase